MYKSFLIIGGIFLIIQCYILALKVPEIIDYSKKGDLVKVGQLIEDGADLNARDKNNITALMWASYNGQIEMVRLLIDNGADVNARGTWTALTWAAACGHIEIVNLLLDKGADINAVNAAGCSALMLATYMGETEIAKTLIDKGARLDTKSKYGITALMMASRDRMAKQKKHTEIVKLLKEAGAVE
jgi:ankyrin repeat protein